MWEIDAAASHRGDDLAAAECHFLMVSTQGFRRDIATVMRERAGDGGKNKISIGTQYLQ